MEALEKEIQRLNKVAPKAANNIRKIGPGAKGAAAGIKAFGASLQAALGPLAPILAGIGGLSAAFNTLKAQDFAEAKFASLGGNSQQLVTNLKALSNELQGQAKCCRADRCGLRRGVCWLLICRRSNTGFESR